MEKQRLQKRPVGNPITPPSTHARTHIHTQRVTHTKFKPSPTVLFTFDNYKHLTQFLASKKETKYNGLKRASIREKGRKTTWRRE